MKSSFIRGAWGCLALGAAVASAACSSGSPEEVGKLELQLRSVGSQGTLYGLRGLFVLNDPEQMSVTASELDQASTASLTPRVGSYALELCGPTSANARCQGVTPFQLFKLTCTDPMIPAVQCAGANQLVAQAVMGAQLTTPNPQNVSIAANQATTATFAFTVPGEGNVVFARGTLNINVSVTQGFADGQPCSAAVECQSKVCAGGACQPATCADGVQNGSESGPDCGGSCPNTCGGAGMCNPPCGANAVCQGGMCVPLNGQACMTNANCPANFVCQNGVCVAGGTNPSCMDGIQNGGELGLDCGGPCPNACAGICNPPCAAGQTCQGGICLGTPVSCMNGLRDGNEAGPDCGGSCPVPCAAGSACAPMTFCGPNNTRLCQGNPPFCP